MSAPQQPAGALPGDPAAQDEHLGAGDAAHALHGPTAVEGRFVTGEGPDAVDVVPEEWAGNAITAQVAAGPGPDGAEGEVRGRSRGSVVEEF